MAFSFSPTLVRVRLKLQKFCSCEIKDFYVAFVQFRPVRRNSSFRRHGLTSVCFFVFAYSVGVRLKLQKFGDGGRRLISFGIRQRNFTLTASVKSQNQRFWICRRIRTHSLGFDPPIIN